MMGISLIRSVRQRGFTIIEIMVAILLLSTSLVAIFGAQFSAISSMRFARSISQATQLGKCKMSELELLFMQEGFQEGDIDESGECCEFLEGEFSTDYKCSWEIKTIEFPDITEMMSGGGDDTDGGDDQGGSSLGESGLGDLIGGPAGGLLDQDGGDEMAEMGMGMMSAIFPIVADLLEQAIRRVTVTVEWSQGNKTRKFELVQYVVHPTQGPLQMMQQANTLQRAVEDGEFGEELGEDFGSSPPPGGPK